MKEREGHEGCDPFYRGVLTGMMRSGRHDLAAATAYEAGREQNPFYMGVLTGMMRSGRADLANATRDEDCPDPWYH